MLAFLILATLATVFAVVFAAPTARAMRDRRAATGRKCLCGMWPLGDGADFVDDRAVRHARLLCQPRREVILR